MDQQHFAALTRTLSRVPSRRDVLSGLVGAGLGIGALRQPEDVVATKRKKKKKSKKKTTSLPPATCTPTCRRKQCGSDGCGGSCGSCAAGQVCGSGTCCTPEAPEVTCAGRCGTVTNGRTCGQRIVCTCPGDQVCLSNGSCATVCLGLNQQNDCPVGSNCHCLYPNSEGGKRCSQFAHCPSATQTCTSTADCPVREHCQVTTCGPGGSAENRCVPLCNG